jgi:hypothetical protein
MYEKFRPNEFNVGYFNLNNTINRVVEELFQKTEPYSSDALLNRTSSNEKDDSQHLLMDGKVLAGEKTFFSILNYFCFKFCYLIFFPPSWPNRAVRIMALTCTRSCMQFSNVISAQSLSVPIPTSHMNALFFAGPQLLARKVVDLNP